MTDNSVLFEPVSLGKLELPNRLAMAPMTRSRATPEGLATAMMAEYYRQRASAGLIITEGIQPSVIGQGSIDTPGLHTAAQTAAWRPVTSAVHEAGGRIFAQLWHSGRVAHSSLYPDGALPVAPSAVASGGHMVGRDGVKLPHPVPRPLTVEEIGRTVEDHAAAARNAIDAGFDGVEIHGANGYLIHQFLADNTNLRTDRYGGSDANRIRFAVEVVEAVAATVGPERTGLRLSPGNPFHGIEEADPEERYLALVGALPLDLAYVHLMEVANRPLTERIRNGWPGRLVLNPHPSPDSFPATPEVGARAVGEGVADVVSLGAYWLANPDLPARVAAGGPYNEADPATFYGGDHRGYTDYPTL